MARFNFKDNPVLNDETFIGSNKFRWDGTAWVREQFNLNTLLSQLKAEAVTETTSNLVNTAPEALDTIQELAAALGNDENFSTTVTNAIAAKATTATYTFTIAAADTWTDTSGIFTLAKTVNGMLSTDNPVADLKLDNTTDPLVNVPLIQTAWANIYRIATSTDGVTFYATALPVFPEDTPVQFKVVR
jgi:hypothetical protein